MRAPVRVALLCGALIAALVVPAEPARAGGAAVPPDPVCDHPPQPARSVVPVDDETPPVPVPGHDGEACERATGARGMEPAVATDSSGALFMGMATEDGVFADPGGIVTGGAQNYLLRSRDDGRSWERLPLPAGVNAAEGMPYVDPVTDRLFVTSWDADVTSCGTIVVHSDDQGESWHRASTNPGCQADGIGDWPKLFSGPFNTAPPGAYPQAVYTCNFVPNILVAASIGCWRSDDGGANFAFTGFLPVHNIACRAGEAQGGPAATAVHGNGQVLANGDVVVPVTVCGAVVVARSGDQGRTWQVHDTGGISGGLGQWVTGRESLAQNIYQNMFFGQTLAQDERGNLFLAYTRDGVHVAVSRDGGATWRQLGRVSDPEVRGAVDVSITARGSGDVALAYFGTGDRGDKALGSGERYRGWIGHSRDALAERPTFANAATSGPDRPPQITNTLTGCCATFEWFIEFTGVRFTGPDQVRAAFVRQDEQRMPQLVLGKMTLLG